MKKHLFSAFAVIVIAFQCAVFTSCQQDSIIDESALPQTALDFIHQWFPEATIASIWKDVEGFHVEYQVTLGLSQQIEFDHKGNWTDIDCGTMAVPAGLVPTEIATLIGQRWPEAFVSEISHDRFGWDVELSNGLDLEFNNKYILRELDD